VNAAISVGTRRSDWWAVRDYSYVAVVVVAVVAVVFGCCCC
jgi:hypothetical protein